MANGDMTQLAASVDEIDTSDNVTIVSAFGKAIILNGANKKVFDPTNVKITTANVGSHPPDHGTVLTGGDSGATMVVDYVTALSSACTIYGNNTSAYTFETGETVTGLDDDGNSISFVLNANEVSPPHWYDYTRYGNNSLYGDALPTKLYLGALHLGRVYLAGDPDVPSEWYASRQGHVHDFLYDQDDVQGACTGGDVEFGRLQDSIRALIPWGNDLLLFGCQNSIYVLMGDPMQGGTMKTVIRGVGVFSNTSWCVDENGTLYFWGSGGMYKMNYGSFNPVPMTDITLPNIVYDEDVDATTHRITMEYDLKRHGVAIGIVNLGSKTNSCYWYERRTEGWFPEEYPEQCSPYSMLYYNSSVTSDRDLLFGCTDGYIRRPDNDGTDDDIGVTDQAVDSYVVFGPFKLGREIGGDGTISNLRGILGGGGSDGTHSDSDNVTYYIYIGDSPQEVMEKIDAGSYALTGTVYAPGFRRGKRQRQSVRGKYAAIQLRNNSDGETWEFEEIEFDITPVGSLA